MKKIIIFCDGGLGNRLGVLIGGILTAKKTGRHYEVCWPVNNWCGCDISDLFNVEFKLYNNNINEFFSQNINNTFVIHENQTNLRLKNVLYHNVTSLENIKNITDDIIVYYHNQIPSYFSEEESVFELSNLKINSELTEFINSFSDENNLKECFGIHLRMTDSPFKFDINKIHDHIKNSNNNFFICSDEKLVEKYLTKLKNVIVFNKTNYVEKLNSESDWRSRTSDTDGRIFDFNVNRNRISVIEAFKDMLLLSKTKIIMETTSTFLKFAKLYNKINL